MVEIEGPIEEIFSPHAVWLDGIAAHPELWRVWEPLNPYWVCPRRRSVAASIRSGRAAKMLSAHLSDATLTAHANFRGVIMDRLIHERAGVNVDTDDVVRGNYASLQAAFDYCGILFDPKLADAAIDRRLWRHS